MFVGQRACAATSMLLGGRPGCDSRAMAGRLALPLWVMRVSFSVAIVALYPADASHEAMWTYEIDDTERS